MQEAKDPKSTGTAGGDTGAESKEPGSDATSKETQSDLEEKGKVTGTSGGEGSDRSSTPSPDGAFDEGGGSSPRENPGPM
jgi:hypothetical protein